MRRNRVLYALRQVAIFFFLITWLAALISAFALPLVFGAWWFLWSLFVVLASCFFINYINGEI